jgi:4-oxalomesaconate hydratase
MSGSRILAFGAHPADAFLASGGTLAKHAAAGDHVTVACFSYGERSHAPAFWEPPRDLPHPVCIEEVQQCKRAEAEQAAAILGTEMLFLDYGECPLEIDAKKMRELVELVRELAPSAVVVHWTDDWMNPDHAIAGQAVLQACRYAGIPGFEASLSGRTHPHLAIDRVYHYAINPMCIAPELQLIPDYYVDIGSFLATKVTALKAFKTQARAERDIGAFAEHIAYSVGYRCGTQYAEAFMTKALPPHAHQYLCLGGSNLGSESSRSPEESDRDAS